MIVCETARLRLRYLRSEDAAFMLALLNEPEYIRNIGDRNVRTLEDARNYILAGPVQGYAQAGFGLYLVELKEDGSPIGICGLLKRDYLDDVDVGFAMREGFRGHGYGYESAAAVLRHAREVLGIERVVAIVSPNNHASIGLLGKLGLKFERRVRAPGQERETSLFVPGHAACCEAAVSPRQEPTDEKAEAGR
jgi:RimJ/RimL family protein N-acetyltransferase